MSIRTKLAAAFGAAFALLVVVSLFGHVQLRTVHRVTHEINDVWAPRAKLLGEIKRSVTELRLLTTRQAHSADPAYRALIATSMDAAMDALIAAERAYQNSISSPEERALFSEFQTLWLEHKQAYRAAAQPQGDPQTAAGEPNTAFMATFEAAAAKLDELIAFSEAQVEIAEEHAHHVYEVALRWTIAAVLLAAMVALGAILWVSRNISSPILRVSDAMRRLAVGDDSVAIASSTERKDEIGVLIAAVAGYRDSLLRSRRLAEAAELERERLDAAVSNMPIGLSMFDASDRLIICNQRYAEIYSLPSELTRPGTPLREIFDQRMRSGTFEGSDPEKYFAELFGLIGQNKPTLRLIRLNSGRVLNVMYQPMADGGWVATHEDVTERRRAEEQIHYMARHDTLTDLPNRAQFSDEVEQALKRVSRGEHVAVLYLDLDRFKSVNDTLGHPVGDALLKTVAQRLRDCVREADTVVRLGGDEFAIVEVGAEQPAGATSLAQRVIEAVSAPYDVMDHQVVIGTSVGIAVAPMDGNDAEHLLKNADMALYRAKCDGRGTYRFFEPEMDARMQARRALELDLRRAFMASQFEVFYQPIVEVTSGRIKCFEALLRWHHPERGMIPPSDFIPVAEEIGLIVPLGEWVLKQACRDAATWPDGITVAVNLSPIQFNGKKLLESVITALAVSKLPANRLELEITEGVLLVDQEATLVTLHQLRALGVRIAMDDFGTGYSSLSYLRSFPFDKIKIDSSFVRNVSGEASSLAIIRAVTGLSKSLGITTTAEGVETDQQLDRVRSEGCTEAQGFLFSEPKPAADVMALLGSLERRRHAAA